MATDAYTSRVREWNTSYERYLTLNQQLTHCDPEERDALQRAVAAQEEDLLDTPAASIDAVRVKLEIIFDGQMTGLDAESEARRLVLEDVHNLAADLGDLIGLKPTQQPQA
jgi:hypothetical protein